MMHDFYSPFNIAMFSALAGGIAADAISTQWFLSTKVEARHNYQIREMNPIARPFVMKGWKGQLFISGVAFASTAGAAALLHHHGHHVWERVIPLVVAGVSGWMAYRNAQL